MLDVLVVDDDDTVRKCVAQALASAGHHVEQAHDGEAALTMLSTRAFELVVCDVQMPRIDGLTLFRRLRREAPGTSVILMTSFGKIPDAVGTLRDGAVDYVTKPFDADEFTDTIVGPIAERRSLMRRFEAAQRERIGRVAGASIVDASLAMRQLIERVGVVSRVDAPVIVTGQAGAGKKLIARTVHVQSPRREGPFVLVSCASLAETMRTSELRDLSDGAPHRVRDEWFRAAEGGTLVLDGLPTLSLTAQASLVRVLDEPTSQARRTNEWKPVGVRVIALTKDDPATLVKDGRLLDTLFFRLNTAQLRVPPLRERRGDLYELVSQLLRELTPANVRPVSLSPDAWRALTSYSFPGNVRELAWAIEHAVVAASGAEVGLEHLPERVVAGGK